jgi:hypothetical protein
LHRGQQLGVTFEKIWRVTKVAGDVFGDGVFGVQVRIFTRFIRYTGAIYNPSGISITAENTLVVDRSSALARPAPGVPARHRQRPPRVSTSTQASSNSANLATTAAQAPVPHKAFHRRCAHRPAAHLAARDD